MSIFIAIKSCQVDVKNGTNQAVRDTWLNWIHPEIEHKFYVGGTPRVRLMQDEMYVDAGDGYGKGESNGHEHLPKKTLAILKDFLTRKEDYLFVCDTDVYVVPFRWAQSGYKMYDYSGVFSPIYPIGVRLESFKDNLGQIISPFYNYASTHACFFSRRGAQSVVDRFADTSSHWADDFMIGQALGPLVVSGEILAGNLNNFEGYAIFHMNASSQKGGRQSPVEWLREMHV